MLPTHAMILGIIFNSTISKLSVFLTPSKFLSVGYLIVLAYPRADKFWSHRIPRLAVKSTLHPADRLLQ